MLNLNACSFALQANLRTPPRGRGLPATTSKTRLMGDSRMHLHDGSSSGDLGMRQNQCGLKMHVAEVLPFPAAYEAAQRSV